MQLAGAEAGLGGRRRHGAAAPQPVGDGRRERVRGAGVGGPAQGELLQGGDGVGGPVDPAGEFPDGGAGPEVGEFDPVVAQLVRRYAEQDGAVPGPNRIAAQEPRSRGSTWKAWVSGPATTRRPAVQIRSMQPSGRTGRAVCRGPGGTSSVQTTAPSSREGRSR